MSLFATLTEDGSYAITGAGYTLIVLVMLGLLIAGCYLTKADEKAKIGTRQLVFSGMALALGFACSFLKLFHLPMGGSVTLFSMFFVTLIGYWYGIGTGLTAGMAYGLLQMTIDPYIISIPQMLMDYVFAFGALGLSGLFSGKKNGMVKGYLLAIFGRFVFAFLSGVIFFGMWAPDSFTFGKVTIALNPYTYSALYNGSYIAAEGIMTLIVLAIPAVRKAIDSVGKMAKA